MDMKLSDGFFDLCINISNENTDYLYSTLERLYEMGFKTVAINQTFDESIFDTEKKRKKGEATECQRNLPNPFNIDELLTKFDGKLKILNRLTFVFSDPIRTHSMGHAPALKKYNLYAVAPKSQAAIQFACSQINADIISINPNSTGLKLNRKLYMQAVERGLHFEIQYCNILNPETRKNAIYFSHLFYTYGKSKNIIVSSGASNANTIRSPYDIVNLCQILGLNEVNAKGSILWQCKCLITKAEKRRHGKAIFSVECMDCNEQDDTD
ncbi:ribonuclease P protein subunit p30 [Prorops nasuta]|uniref:ribonuclease P protein subunit p30 n=1 Tax=Prorops nasuta TaxID=863751 RepID=UPI0034CFCB21